MTKACFKNYKYYTCMHHVFHVLSVPHTSRALELIVCNKCVARTEHLALDSLTKSAPNE